MRGDVLLLDAMGPGRGPLAMEQSEYEVARALSNGACT